MIRSKNNKTPTDKSNQATLADELIKLENTLLAEAIADHLINDLIKLKVSIEIHKRSYHGDKSICKQLYLQKKELVSKYLSSRDGQEKEQFVLFCFVSFQFLFFNFIF